MKQMAIHNRSNHMDLRRMNCARAVGAVALLVGINLIIGETTAAQETSESLTDILKQDDVAALVAQAMQNGDADRGKSIFHREKLGCVKCHVASPTAIQQGLRSLGPDQRDVGDRLRPEQIVEGVLFPNRSIAKGYESYVVVTVDGKVHKGVLRSQSQQEVVVLDPEKTEAVSIAS